MSRPSSRSSARNSTCARTPSAVKAGVPGVCANAAVAVQASSRVARRFIDDPWRNEVLQAGVTVTSYGARARSEEHTSELQSLMRISYAVFCLKKKKKKPTIYYVNSTENTIHDT